MITNTTMIRDYFSKLGFSQDVADIYLALHRKGPQTISELSRTAKVERTRIYRLLETLEESNLVEIETEYKKSIIKAAPITNLRILISKRAQTVDALSEQLGLIEKVLAQQTAIKSPTTHIQFYRGEDGEKQMFWNTTKAKGVVTTILAENMQSRTNNAFFERWVARCNERNIHFRGIVGDAYLANQRDWYTRRSNERLKHWSPRYIDKKDFSIVSSTVIYDNVVSFFNWKDNEVFGIEVYNQDIADTQRQFFEMLWSKAKPYSEKVAGQKI